MRYLIIVLAAMLSACDQNNQTVALGTLERERIAHTATINEVVTALPVAQGAQVSQGTLLVQLDSRYQQAQVSKAEADVVQAQANLDKLHNGARKEEIAIAKAQVAGAKASLFENQANYNRLLNLRDQKVISQANLDTALATRDAAQANLQSAQEQLQELLNGTREEDIRIAEAHLLSVQATLASEQKKLDDLTIVATRDGIVDSLPWNVGERVTVGSPVAIVLAGSAPFARVYVPESHRVKVKVGDSLAIHVDGIDRTITGHVKWISTDPAFTPYYALNQQERSRLMYLAEVQLPDSESALPNGVPVQVELP